MTKKILGIGLLMTLTVAIPSITRTELLWPDLCLRWMKNRGSSE